MLAESGEPTQTDYYMPAPIISASTDWLELSHSTALSQRDRFISTMPDCMDCGVWDHGGTQLTTSHPSGASATAISSTVGRDESPVRKAPVGAPYSITGTLSSVISRATGLTLSCLARTRDRHGQAHRHPDCRRK